VGRWRCILKPREYFQLPCCSMESQPGVSKTCGAELQWPCCLRRELLWRQPPLPGPCPILCCSPRGARGVGENPEDVGMHGLGARV